MDINSFVIGFKKGRAGAGRFPVADFFARTVEELDLKGVTVLGSGALQSLTYLKKLSIPDVAQITASSIVSCTSLGSLTFPKSLKYIGSRAIASCSGLTTVTFEGAPDNINAQAVANCPNIRIVNVPWAEGEVANAPWGMTEATINYNYKGD